MWCPRETLDSFELVLELRTMSKRRAEDALNANGGEDAAMEDAEFGPFEDDFEDEFEEEIIEIDGDGEVVDAEDDTKSGQDYTMS